MQYYSESDIDNWERGLEKAMGENITCSTCNTLQALAPGVIDGTAIWLEKSTANNILSIPVRFRLFTRPVYPNNGYAVAVCSHCRALLVVDISEYYEVSVVWPLPGIAVSEKVPAQVRAAVVDARLSQAAGSVTGAVMSARTAVARIQRVEEVGSLTELWEKKRLSPAFFDTANEPRLWGHVMAHDDFDPDDVTLGHVAELMDFLDTLLEMVYVTPAKLEAMKEARESIEKQKAAIADPDPSQAPMDLRRVDTGSSTASPPVEG